MAHTCPGQSVLDMDVPVLMRMSTLPKTSQRRKIPGRPVRTLARSEPCIESSTWVSSEAVRPPVLTERRVNGQNCVGNLDTRCGNLSGRPGPPTASTEGQILAVQQHLMWLEERLKELQKISDYGETAKGGCREEKASDSNYYCITQGVDSNPGTSNTNSPVDGIDSTTAMTIGKENGAPLYSKQNTQKKRVSQGVCTVKSIPPMVRIDSLDAPNNVSTVLMDDRYQPYRGHSSNHAFQNLGTTSSLSRSSSPRLHPRGFEQLDATSTLSASTSSNLSPLSQDEQMAVRPVGFAQSISIFGPEGGSIGEDIWEFDGCDENAHSTTTPTPSGMGSLPSTNATTPNQPLVASPSASPSAFHLGMQSLNVDSWSLDPSSGVPPSPALSNVSNCVYHEDMTQRPDGDGFSLKRLNSQTPTGGTPSPRSLKPTFSFTSSMISKAKARITGRAIKKDHDLEDLEMQTVRYKPEGIDKLCRSTKFTKKELQLMYRGFKQECPSGLVNEETFKEIYSQFFPQGDTGHPIYGRSKEPKNSSHYAHFVFNSFDTDHNGSITFEEFVQGLSVLSRGSFNDKLNWAFNLYDINGDGYITREEMLSIIQSIYDMMGKYSEPTSEDITPGEHVERVFQKMDLNKDGVVTIDEFIDSCRADETITKSMHVFDTIL